MPYSSEFWNSTTSEIRKRLLPMFPARWRPQRSLPEPHYPLGLSEREVRGLDSLSQHPEWPNLLKALEGLYHLQARNILGGSLSQEQYHFQAGFLRAIETVATLPETLTTVMTRVQHDRGKRSIRDDHSHIWYGTPYYDVESAAGRPEGVGKGQDGP